MRALRKLAPVVVGCLALVGCAPSASTAAVVNGSIITEAQLDAASEGCAEVFQTEANQLRLAALNNMVIGRLADQINSANGLELTEGERQQFLQGSAQGQLMLSNDECAKVADGLASYLLGIDRLGREVYATGIEDAKVEPNRRYGAWDPAQGTIGGSGSLSLPAEQ